MVIYHKSFDQCWVVQSFKWLILIQPINVHTNTSNTKYRVYFVLAR
uniref:Uncharacterized protein n=1 Tax=Lepeophtheirus salmonis TaxID=72036 RepID=A0A0K2TZW9_LEPSM